MTLALILGTPFRSTASYFELTKAKAEKGDSQAQYDLGEMYMCGRNVLEDPKLAFKWFRAAADHNHASAQYRTGFCYWLGIGVEQDMEEAVKWYRKAAAQNNASAQYILGVCYYNGRAGVVQDQQEALRLYRKAAAQNDASAQYALSECYQIGQLVDTDYAEAYKWWLLSAPNNTRTQLALPKLKAKLTPEQIAKGEKRARDFNQQRKSILDLVQPGKDISFGNQVLHVTNRHGNFLIGVKIVRREPDGNTTTITSETGKLLPGSDSLIISVVLHDAQIEKTTQKTLIDELTLNFPTSPQSPNR